MTAEMFNERGDTVSLFSDATKALNFIRNERSTHLLLTSLECEPISGLELCWHARLTADASRPLHILVMSSFSDSNNLAKVLDSGADDLIPKPVSRLMLYAKLRLADRLRKAQLELARLAETDTLTEVLNRRAFLARLKSTLEVTDGSEPTWLMIIDIDHFKQVNDTEGHPAGDKVIRAVAAEAVKMCENVGRLGGEEFAVIVRGPEKEQVMRIANHFRQRCADLAFDGKSGQFHVTCSIGLSPIVANDTMERVLKRADIALYDAKSSGRNLVKIFEAVS
jgi:diguanylate cyclase (GGDEF)-like protein